MSKSPKDATRFTSTGVWTHTKPGGRATRLQFTDPAPENETPQQKVKRLREAANRAKMAQVTKWDIMYMYGRRMADTAHRLTVYGLVFATGCIGVLGIFSIGDMIVYNRRRRRVYFENLEKEQAKILNLAREAVARGDASPAQAALVEGVREQEEARAREKAEKSIGKKMLWFLNGEDKENQELVKQKQLAIEESKRMEAAAAAQKMSVTEAVQEARAKAATTGGPIDHAAEGVAKTSKDWLRWAFGWKTSN